MANLGRLYSSLPRDIQMRILRLLDIDARIALGVHVGIGKLPDNLEQQLVSVSRFLATCDHFGTYVIDMVVFNETIHIHTYKWCQHDGQRNLCFVDECTK